MRIAPSRRMVSPLSIGFSTMWTARLPYSEASPSLAGCGLGDRGLDRFLVGDVGVKGDALYFSGDLLGVFLVLVDHADLGALGGHGARGGGTEAGATAGDENGNVFQLHLKTFPWAFLF